MGIFPYEIRKCTGLFTEWDFVRPNFRMKSWSSETWMISMQFVRVAMLLDLKGYSRQVSYSRLMDHRDNEQIEEFH